MKTKLTDKLVASVKSAKDGFTANSLESEKIKESNVNEQLDLPKKEHRLHAVITSSAPSRVWPD